MEQNRKSLLEILGIVGMFAGLPPGNCTRIPA